MYICNVYENGFAFKVAFDSYRTRPIIHFCFCSLGPLHRFANRLSWNIGGKSEWIFWDANLIMTLPRLRLSRVFYWENKAHRIKPDFLWLLWLLPPTAPILPQTSPPPSALTLQPHLLPPKHTTSSACQSLLMPFPTLGMLLSFHCPIMTFICLHQLNHHLLWPAFPHPLLPAALSSRSISSFLSRLRPATSSPRGEVVRSQSVFSFHPVKTWHRMSIKDLWHRSIEQDPSSSILSIFLILIVVMVS